MLLRRIVADQENGARTGYVTHGGRCILLPGNGPRESRKIRGAVMVNVIGAQDRSRKLLEQVVFFIGGAVGADHTNGLAAFGIQDFTQALADVGDSLFPCCGDQFAVASYQRVADTIFVIKEIEGIAALDAEKLAVDSALVAVVAAHNVHAGIGAADAQSGLAAVATMSADGADVLHLPWAGLVTIGA